MVEQQAISRIYRLGQTKPVSVTRFVISETFEMSILDRQTRKQILADLILGREKLKTGQDGFHQLVVRDKDGFQCSAVIQIFANKHVESSPARLLILQPEL